MCSAYAQLSKYYDEAVCGADQEAAALRKLAATEENNFRNSHQLLDTRREWDLNRPDAKLLDAPARLGDHDARCGISSLQVFILATADCLHFMSLMRMSTAPGCDLLHVQKFHGEDLKAADRKAAQQQQCHEWWLQQKADTQAQKEQEKEQLRAHGDLVRLYDTVQQAVMGEEKLVNRASQRSVMDDNKRLATHRRATADKHSMLESGLRSNEIRCALENPVLSEDPRQAASSLSAGRVRVDHWKGMTQAEHQSIIHQQFMQQQELKSRRQEEVRKEAQWAQASHMTDQAIKEQQRQVDNLQRQQEKDRLHFLQQQAEEKRTRDAALNDVYANAVSKDYFSQFGTSHR